MPNNTTNSYNNMTAGDKVLASFLREVGNNTNTTYGQGGSSATVWMARWALVYKYDYSSQADEDPWNYDRIKCNVLNKLPVFISGWGKKNGLIVKDGHSYVIDGVQYIDKKYRNIQCNYEYKRRTELLHYNFGWNGGWDGWFSQSIADYPAYNGTDIYFIDKDVITGYLFPNFQYNKNAIYDIKPN